MKKNTLSMIIAAALATSVSATAFADEHNALSKYEDQASVSMTGTITEVREDEFDMKSGSGIVTVEIDDANRESKGYMLSSGDKVTVSGVVDDDWFEGREIEANALYVWKLDVTFMTDDDAMPPYGKYGDWDMDDMTELTGTVLMVDDDEFTISTGNGYMTVDVGELANNPLDDDGFLKIMVGDRVRVVGEIDDGWFDGRELEAEYINVLR